MSLSERLVIAAKKGNSREVRKLLGRGAMFTKDQYGNTALHEAAWNGNKDIVKSLLGAFCYVDGINHTGFTPLHLASQNGHAKVTKILLKWRADPCLLNQHGETALHLVAKYNHPSVIVAFSAFKVPMDIRGKDGNTALHIAAKLGNVEVMRALLHHGADPLLTNVQGIRSLGFADAGNYKDCVKLLHVTMKSKSKESPTHSPTVIQRSCTYSSSSSEVTAAKMRMMKAMGRSKKKQHSHSSKENKKHKRGGYYSEDELSYYLSDSSLPPLPCPHFSDNHEVLNRFSCGAVGGVDHSFSQLCRSSSTASSEQSKSVSIDQLLNEIEMESRGSGDSSTPTEENKGLIKPYAEIRHLHSSRPPVLGCSYSPQHVCSHSPCHVCGSPMDAKSYLLSSQEGRVSTQSYDILQPSMTMPSSTSFLKVNSTLPPSPHHGIGGSNMHILGEPHIRDEKERSMVLTKVHSSPSKSPSRSPGKSTTMSPGKSLLKSPCKSPHKSLLRSPGREQRKSEKQRSDDMDTYVYMAPLIKAGSGRGTEVESDSEMSPHLPNESCRLSLLSGYEGGNKNSKKAVICNHEIDTLTRHEPDSTRVPTKGILSQASVNEMDKTLLEQYLQEELETMRQAFQIRLGQLEKRYKKQLIVEQHRNVAQHHIHNQQEPKIDPTSYVNIRRRHNPHSEKHNSAKRRNSWHSYISSEQELDKLALPDDPRSESSLGIDSDLYMTEESDIEMEPMPPTKDLTAKKGKMEQSNEKNKKSDSSSSLKAYLDEFPESMRQEVNHRPEGSMHVQTRKHKEGVKGGDKSWRKGKETKENMPRLPSVNKEDLSKEDDKAKRTLIQHKVEEYRQKMHNFQERSEAHIFSIEEMYLKQMDEMKKYKHRGYGNPSHMTNRMKGLESLDTRTIV